MAGVVTNQATGSLGTTPTLPISLGGTNSGTALNNGRVMVSSGGSIVESAILESEIALLDGIASITSGTSNNDKIVTQGYVDDVVTSGGFWERTGTTLTTYTLADSVRIGSAGAANGPLHIEKDDVNEPVVARFINTNVGGDSYAGLDIESSGGIGAIRAYAQSYTTESELADKFTIESDANLSALALISGNGPIELYPDGISSLNKKIVFDDRGNVGVGSSPNGNWQTTYRALTMSSNTADPYKNSMYSQISSYVIGFVTQSAYYDETDTRWEVGYSGVRPLQFELDGSEFWFRTARVSSTGAGDPCNFLPDFHVAGSAGLIEVYENNDDATGVYLTTRKRRMSAGVVQDGEDDDNLFNIVIKGYNDASTPEEIIYSSISFDILDASDGDEGGKISFWEQIHGIDTEVVTIFDGNAGINVNSNLARLTTKSGTDSSPTTSGSSVEVVSFRAVGNSNSVMDIGCSSTSGAWIQTRNQTDYSVNYNLNLNPNGGNIGFGINSPKALVSIRDVGSLQTTGTGINRELIFGRNVYSDGSWKRTLADNHVGFFQFGNDGSVHYYQASDANTAVDSAITRIARFSIDTDGTALFGAPSNIRLSVGSGAVTVNPNALDIDFIVTTDDGSAGWKVDAGDNSGEGSLWCDRLKTAETEHGATDGILRCDISTGEVYCTTPA